MDDASIPSGERIVDPGSVCPGAGGRLGLDLNAAVADRAAGDPSHNLQHALLVGVEARLAQEVRGLIGALGQFAGRAQCIGEELPSSSHFGKLVTGFLSLLSLQFAYSLGKGLDKPILLDDGAEYLRELRLSLDDLVREIDLDGRRFLAVAFVEQRSAEVFGGGESGGER